MCVCVCGDVHFWRKLFKKQSFLGPSIWNISDVLMRVGRVVFTRSTEMNGGAWGGYLSAGRFCRIGVGTPQRPLRLAGVPVVRVGGGGWTPSSPAACRQAAVAPSVG